MPEAFATHDLLQATVKHMRDVANWAGTAAYSAMGLRVAFDLKNPALVDTFRRIAGSASGTPLTRPAGTCRTC